VAIYRLEAKVISRSQGRSAVASAAYRAAVPITDERTGQSFDYSRKRGVLHAEIVAPEGTPEWMHDRSQLWNAVEKVERRKDSQLARDLVLALPHELTHAQRVELVKSFVRSEFVDEGMIADIAVHAPDRGGDGRNHHAHVMLTMRALTGEGFGPKVRAWNDTERLEGWREHWADEVNRRLERYGFDARVDHRSLAEQGVDREPEPKQGPIATEIERQGRPSRAGDERRAVQERNDERAKVSAELATVTAEIASLQQERALGSGQTADESPATNGEETAERARGKRGIGPMRGGMVAQQMDALKRFRENSAALEARRRAQPETSQTGDLKQHQGIQTLQETSSASTTDPKTANEERVQRVLGQIAKDPSRDGGENSR
jgi:ATP-dependent exoDNAse (exonuclease V) alpha subunit